MEMHASTVIWEGDGSLTIHDKTQGAQNSQAYVCGVFGLAKDKVRVVSPYVGGAFGSGLRPQYQLFLAVMAALAAGAVGPGRPDPRADVHLRLPAGNHPVAGARRRRPTARSSPSRTTRWPTPRGSRTTRRTSSTGRGCSTAATTSSSATAGEARPVHPVRHARARRRDRRLSRSRRRWTSWPMPPGSIRSSCACATMPTKTGTKASRSPARSCGPVTRKVPSGSAGRSAVRARARCAKAGS